MTCARWSKPRDYIEQPTDREPITLRVQYAEAQAVDLDSLSVEQLQRLEQELTAADPDTVPSEA